MPVVKGGVWTNIEDEIVKVAVSKYGLNQWARVSSLLARKTPKQCKARWFEWLDPTIRKIEWSREEDEKLLHLAKLMPTQWRTIAPIVGRTATQCLERYQKLLDEAEAREATAGDDELGFTGPVGGETAPSAVEGGYRLRAGELDADPESKPARPDTIDLDEDEKEMLSEARARLANTQGKKARRKARERQLEESHRLAVLQKRRELKNAGINIKVTTVKKGQMDYNADIPFEKAPMPGFYDTTEEITRNDRQQQAFDPRKQQANKRKADDEDDDRKKKKKDKNVPEGFHAALRAGQMQKIREAEQSKQRRPLVLPAPQVSETEMEEIVKIVGPGSADTPVQTSSFSTGASRDMVGATPVDIKTRTRAMGETPLRTPRDTFSINTPGGPGMTAATPRDASMREGLLKSKLRSQLSSLPKPRETEWEIEELPDEKEEKAINRQTIAEDAADRDRRAQKAAAKTAAEEFKRQSQTYQKALPRPRVVDLDVLTKRANEVADPDESLIAQESALMIANESRKLPVPNGRVQGTAPPLTQIQDSDLAAGRALLAQELSEEEAPSAWMENFVNSWTSLHTVHGKEHIPGLAIYDDNDNDQALEKQQMFAAFDNAQASLLSQADEGNKLEKKLSMHHKGYATRAKTLGSKIIEASAALRQARIEVEAFRNLQATEEGALLGRLEALRQDVHVVARQEREAQELYRSHVDELESLPPLR